MADIEEPVPDAGFKSVDTSGGQFSQGRKDDVESPSLSSSNALARFEFEPGKSKDGTKVLMVEWEDDDTTKRTPADWEVSWEGKRTVLPARESQDDDSNSSSSTSDLPINRLYFLLGAGVEVPTAVHLKKGDIAWRTNPLPAIFSPELGATARQAGKKGVLHTIWAKKRLQVLQKEIDSEAKDNAEGIGLEMAMAEMEWIEQNFGVQSRPSNLSVNTAAAANAATSNSNNPASPRTPGGGRFMDKLKGLRIGTSDQELKSSTPSTIDTNATSSYHNPLSPEGSDVAVGTFGSFAALKGFPELSSLAAKPPQIPQSQSQPQAQAQPTRKIAAQRPPDSLLAQQRNAAGMSSLDAMASGSFNSAAAAPRPTASGDDKDEEDLFALPISPRSPDMTKSPFTFAAQDPMRYVQQEKA